MALAIAIIVFAAAIISIAANIIQLRSNLVAMKITMAQLAQTENTKAAADKNSDRYWHLKYLWRKQKSGLFVLVMLLVLPYVQFRLTGALSFSFLFILVHSAILFYVICYFIGYLMLADWAEETRRGAEKQPPKTKAPD